jgi:hypothetical protein
MMRGHQEDTQAHMQPAFTPCPQCGAVISMHTWRHEDASWHPTSAVSPITGVPHTCVVALKRAGP